MGIRRRWWPARHGIQSISGSVVFGDVVMVQGVRGDVTISLDRPPYRVAQEMVRAVPLSAADARAQPSRMLLARHRIVPFTGRDGMLSDLAGWLAGEAPLAVRLIHAPGGQGKTRLAGEVADRCAADGWTVWRVLHTPTPLPGSRVDLPGGPVLAVVDYADRWPPSALLTLITQLQQLSAATSSVVRVLLLARSSGYWWPALADRVESDLTVPTGDVALPSLSADRASLYAAAAGRFAAVLGPGDTVRPPGPGDDRLAAVVDTDWPLPSGLGDDRFGQVLAVHMAALAAVDARWHGDDTPAGPEAVSAYLLRREAAHWHHMHARAENPLVTPPEVMHRTVWTATLTGALARPDAREALRQAGLDGGDRLIDDHRACYPSADSRTVLEPLHPDRLGEDLIALSVPGHDRGGGLTDDWTLTAASLLTGAPGRGKPGSGELESGELRKGESRERDPGEGAPWSGAALTVLVETARRWPHVATELLYPLIRQRPELAIAAGGAMLTRLAEIPGIDPEVLEPIQKLLPPHRHIDLDVAAAAISTVLTGHRLAGTADPAARARGLLAHAVKLLNAGRNEDAWRSADRAAVLFRESGREAWRPEFVDALIVAVHALRALSRHAEALPLAEEAVALQRQADSADVQQRIRLARVLDSLGLVLAHLGRDGRAPAEEAVAVYRELVESGGAQLWPVLAGSLSNLGFGLQRLGRRAAALSAVEEAVGLHRRLAAADPAVFLPDLAISLINLGLLLMEIGRREDALLATEEAVSLYQGLVEANPDAFEPALSQALLNASLITLELGRRDDAIAFGGEAVRLLRRLAVTDPAAHRQRLAAALVNVGLSLLWSGSAGAALSDLSEAVDLCRQLADADPLAYSPDLAKALGMFGLALSATGRFAESLAAAEEGIAIYRRLAAANPEAYEDLLARALINLGAARYESAATSDALEPAEEAVVLMRRLAAGNPAAHLPGLAQALNNLGLYLWTAGRAGEALPPGTESVRLLRRLDAANPAAYRASLAEALCNLGNRLGTLGRYGEALAATDECLHLYRELTARDPAAYQHHFATMLNNRGGLLATVGRIPEALAMTGEAIGIRRRLAAANPAVHQADLAGSLLQLALWHELAGDGREALRAAEEAVGVVREVAAVNPMAHRLSLARALGAHARAGLRADASRSAVLASAEESVRIYLDLKRDDPAAYEDELELSRQVLAAVRDGSQPGS
ncbi:tetratricopeptide repeat protein [Actinoplanes flavus]|uniref:Tetratricopeptide repeat protein n=1 Tax=Actinoplanes flavus TaxID=2820290 RepID=A0ABS3URR5_9ACTN|nr:tetratricopeptide repeat protein [Actinoplanes flavus]MBO3741211.1 tetratricopeptide repeat protein [Actinoplanes flavus]